MIGIAEVVRIEDVGGEPDGGERDGQATGQDDRLDPDFCAQLLGGMEQMEAAIRSSGQFGARVEVPDGADTQTRMLGFIGRDPFWPAAPRS